MRAADGFHGFGDGGVKAERFFDQVKIVVDGLGDADDSDLFFPGMDFRRDFFRGPHGAVAAHAKEDVDFQKLQVVHHDLHILRPARRGQDAAADMRDVLDVVGRELDRYLAVFRIQSAQSVFDSQNIFYAVAVEQRHRHRTDDVVDAGAEASARNNGRLGLCGIEKNLFPGARRLQRQRLSGGVFHGVVIVQARVE